MKKGASGKKKTGEYSSRGYWKRIPIGFTYDEWVAMEGRMREQGKTKIAPYLKGVEAQQGEITNFKQEKARELAYEMRRWHIPPELVMEAYKRL